MEEQPIFTLEDRVTDFAMAIRELLMSYFKGTCVDSLVRTYIHGVSLERKRIRIDPNQSRPYNWQRDEHNQTDPVTLMFHESPLMELQHQPDKATFLMPVFRRSEELSNVYGQLQVFFEKYLPGVELEESSDKKWEQFTASTRDKDITVVPRSIPTLFPEPEEDGEEDVSTWGHTAILTDRTVYSAEAVSEAADYRRNDPEQTEQPSPSFSEWYAVRLGGFEYQLDRNTNTITNVRRIRRDQTQRGSTNPDRVDSR